MTTLTTLRRIAVRSQDTLIIDAIGATALVVILLVCLHLPSFI